MPSAGCRCREGLPESQWGMADEVVLHVGLEKTGTTSIQYWLSRQREELRERGFCYPDSGMVECGHHDLAFAAGFSTLEADVRVFDELRRELASWDGAVLLSSENFSIGGTQVKIANLRELLGRLGRRIRVLIYYRAQGEWLRSVYIERMRWGLRQPFDEFCRVIVPTYEELPALWQCVFGMEQVCVRTVHSGCNVIPDYAMVVGLDLPPETWRDVWLNRTDSEKQAGLDAGLRGVQLPSGWGWVTVSDSMSR